MCARFVVSLLLLGTLWLFAEPISQLKPTDYVNDFAHVLDTSTVAQIDDIAQQLDHKANAQIAVVTIRSLDGRDIESYTSDLFKKWGIGGKSSNRGVLILFSVGDHRYRTEVGYGLEPILPDGKVGGFGREAVPLLRQDNYGGAAQLMASRVADVIAHDGGIQLTGNNPPPSASQPDETGHGISAGGIITLLILGAIVLFTPLGRFLLGMFLLGGGGYRHGGWGGGGGFGGGSFGGGGGGFGGFGGGSSGGGGASGSW
jgi:uncharacterized protein